MMKKNGFTLAEVLITLAIIGVVATLTLPALMTNTGEQQSVAGLKKGINTLTEAAQMNAALEGFDYSGLVSNAKTAIGADGNATQSLYGLLVNRTAADTQKSGAATKQPGYKVANTNTNYVIFLRDGGAVAFDPAATSASLTTTHGVFTSNGIKAVYDINGTKGPNILSNCDSKTTNVTTDKAKAAITTCSRDKRVIKDQFGIVLTGGNVLPNGPAARWAVSQ